MRVISQLLLTFLLNACWQIAFLAAAVAVGARLLNKGALRSQHLLWVLALVLSFCLPLLTTAFVSRDRLFTSAIRSEESPGLKVRGLIDLPAAQANAFTPLGSPSSAIPVNAKLAAVILALYVVLFGYRTFGLFRAWQRTRRIKRSARLVEPSESLQRIMEECQTAFQTAPVSLLYSDAVPLPITIGVRRPLVILPEQLLRDADTELLAAAMGHEIVHVWRRDYLLNLIYEFVYLPLSFHPAAALVRRRINQTRELCCDELVADRLLKADVYARSLVRLAGSAPQLRKLAPTTTVGIADADILEVRIMSLLNRSEISQRGKKLLLIAAAFVLAIPCATAAAFNFQFDIARQDLNPIEPQGTSNGKVQVEKKPRLIYHTDPEYPEDARAKQIEGRVGLSLTVGVDGLVQDVQVTKPVYPSLDESAVANVRKWRFDPQVKDGQPTAKRLNVEVDFNLSSWQQDKRTQEERELKERAERDPEFRAKLEQREREEREVKEHAEREDQDLRNRIQQETNVEARATLEALLKRRQEELQRTSESRPDNSMYRESRGAGVAAAKWAKISMEQAIVLATSAHPGTVIQCSLTGEREDRVYYHVVIMSGAEENPITTHVLVNAIDGSVSKTERAQAAINGGTLNGKALNLPRPVYPEIARAAMASGSVAVEITIDESGNVISAKAISGHPLLQAAAVTAARGAQFSPTKLNGEPVKVQGIITYDFVAK